MQLDEVFTVFTLAAPTVEKFFKDIQKGNYRHLTERHQIVEALNEIPSDDKETEMDIGQTLFSVLLKIVERGSEEECTRLAAWVGMSAEGRSQMAEISAHMQSLRAECASVHAKAAEWSETIAAYEKENPPHPLLRLFGVNPPGPEIPPELEEELNAHNEKHERATELLTNLFFLPFKQSV